MIDSAAVRDHFVNYENNLIDDNGSPTLQNALMLFSIVSYNKYKKTLGWYIYFTIFKDLLKTI